MKKSVTFSIYVCVVVFLSALPGTSNGAVQMEHRSVIGAALIIKPTHTHIRKVEKNVEFRSYAIAADSSSVEEAGDSEAVEDADDSSAIEDADDSSAVEDD